MNVGGKIAMDSVDIKQKPYNKIWYAYIKL